MNHLSYHVRNFSKIFLRIFETFLWWWKFLIFWQKRNFCSKFYKKTQKRIFIIVKFQLKNFKTRKFLLKIFKNLKKTFKSGWKWFKWFPNFRSFIFSGLYKNFNRFLLLGTAQRALGWWNPRILPFLPRPLSLRDRLFLLPGRYSNVRQEP